ncbi:MAG: hypothetical protein ACRDKT_02950 [Actinomycetota bacterium]
MAIAVLVAIAAVVLLTRPDPAPIPDGSTNDPPDFSLTDTEAIERFRELDTLKLRAYRTRDVTLVASVFSSDSELAKVARREIRNLTRSDVIPRTRFVTRRVEVLDNSDDAIRLLQVVEVYPRFVDEAGNDVTASGRDELQRVEVVLHRDSDEWLLFDALIVSADPLRS